MATDFDLRLVPYSGKFSWVQNFADMPSDPSEEIFVVFIFVGYTGTPVVQTTPLSLHVLYVVHYVAIRDVRSLVKIFVVFIFAVTCRSAKTRKIAPHENFPLLVLGNDVTSLECRMYCL